MCAVGGCGKKIFFPGLVIVVLLVIGGVETNPGRQSNNRSYFGVCKNEELDSKAIKGNQSHTNKKFPKLRKASPPIYVQVCKVPSTLQVF
jgi:hypothetical protein